ncbi:MAG: NUDIX domain-containing protein [Bacillota bacterium]
MELVEKRLSSKIVYRGKILNLRVDSVELPNGRTASREVVEYAGAVAIVPFIEKDEILLVRQYRYPVGKLLLEVPAGKMEEGEDPGETAARELIEETGYRAGEIKFLFSYYSTPGFTNEKMYLYMARNLTYVGERPDEDEFVQAERVTMEKALEMIKGGGICDAKSIVGILAAKREMDS